MEENNQEKTTQEHKPLLISKTKVKEYVKGLGFSCSGDVLLKLNSLVENILEDGTIRAAAYGQKTLKAKSL